MQVHVAKADLWTLPVDAVVNPANSLGIMGGGVGGALRRQGGDQIQQAAMAASPIAVGAALVTTAGQLPAKHVIHVPTMEEPGMKIGAENVRRAARAALIAADRNNFKVIAIPGIGTDLGDVPTACSFAPRCKYVEPKCLASPPPLYDAGPAHQVRCVLVAA